MSRKDAVNVNPDDEPIAGGYYTHQWSYEEIKVERENGVTFIGPKLHDPNQVREAFPVRMLNVTAGLGIPGSYVFSEKAHVILVNPVSDAAIEHSATPNMFIINDTNNLEIRDITVEKTAGTAFVINNSENVTLSSIFIKLSNNGGIEINGGRKVAVTNSAIVDVLGSGIAVRGGDRKELIGSEHSIVNTSITHFGWGAHSYRPAVAVDGVGITVSGCYMSDGPHAAVLLSGNDNSIINNVIYDVLIEADDAGAIYGGKDTTFRGNMMNGNVIVLHNKSDQFVSAIFFDDQLSGSDVKGNVFIGGTVGVYIGGGRDNGVMDNLFVGQSRAAIKIDARGLTWQKEEQSRSPSVKIDTRRGPWLKYRGLQERDTDRPGEPTNNSIADNMYLFTKANEQDAILRCDQPLNASGSCINEKRTGEFHTIQALATLLGGWLGIGIRD